jgi:hypothetical protein
MTRENVVSDRQKCLPAPEVRSDQSDSSAPWFEVAVFDGAHALAEVTQGLTVASIQAVQQFAPTWVGQHLEHIDRN